MRRFAERVEPSMPAPLLNLLGAADLADAVISPEQLRQRGSQDWMPLISAPGGLRVSVADPLVRTPHLQIDSEWQTLRRPYQDPAGVAAEGRRLGAAGTVQLPPSLRDSPS